jgi:LysR family cyn operon transcriptional activator
MDPNIMCPRSLRYLLAVAEHHNFTRAAEALFVSQPTLSQQIKHLEEELDAQLLDRSGRSVRLTDAGEVYVSYARRALGELDKGKRAIHELRDLSRGSLRIGMTPITEYMAAPLLDNFNTRYPGITVNTLEMSQDDIESGVAEDFIDVGIAFTNTFSTESRSSEIDTHVLFIESLNLAVGNDHTCFMQQTPFDKYDLEQQSLILLNSNFALRRHFDVYCLEHEITPKISMETNSLSVIIEIVRLGRFATVLPDTISCAQYGLEPLVLLPELPQHTITLVCHKDAYKSPACMAFTKLAEEWRNDRCPTEEDKPCPVVDACVHNEA